MYRFIINGRKYDFGFDLSDIVKLNAKYEGDISKYITKIVNLQDTTKIVDIFIDIIESSYLYNGNHYISLRHNHPEAFNKIFYKLATDPKVSEEFIKQILPDEYIAVELARGRDYATFIKEMFSVKKKPTEEIKKEEPTIMVNRGIKLAVTDVIYHNDKVTIVKFSDGTFTKSVCSDNDCFDPDIGITVCLCKKMLGGSTQYNNLIRRIHKSQEEKAEEKRKAAAEKAARRKKEVERQAKRVAKTKQAMDTYKNDISEAVVEALKRYDDYVAEVDKSEQ